MILAYQGELRAISFSIALLSLFAAGGCASRTCGGAVELPEGNAPAFNRLSSDASAEPVAHLDRSAARAPRSASPKLPSEPFLAETHFDGRPSNPIQLENTKPGDADWRLVNPATNHEIEGYASATSAKPGDSLYFFVHTIDTAYSLVVFRMGWYGGTGARKITSPIVLAGTRQPMPLPDPVSGLIECSWTNPYRLLIPRDRDWTSGIYIVKLTGLSTGKDGYILFVVRNDESHSHLLMQNAVNTYQAYNDWGGLSLYTTPRRAYQISFNRPYRTNSGSGFFFVWEYPMVRFLEREGYDVSYTTDVDSHVRGDLLLQHKAVLFVGHSEYWSWTMRDNTESARDQGVSLAFFSANNSYWQIRFQDSALTGGDNRTLICYKNKNLDPYFSDGLADHKHLVTVQYRDPLINRPEDAMVGVMFDSETLGTHDVVISDASNWMLDGTGLSEGTHLLGLLGYEADRTCDNTPPQTVTVAHSPYFVAGHTHYADMVSYQTAAGSTVVATGTMQWSWGLDSIEYDGSRNYSNSAVQQVTRNILQRLIDGPPPQEHLVSLLDRKRGAWALWP